MAFGLHSPHRKCEVRERELRALLPSTGAPHPMGEMTSPRLWPLKWLLNGGPRAAPGLGSGHTAGRWTSRIKASQDDGTRNHRFSGFSRSAGDTSGRPSVPISWPPFEAPEQQRRSDGQGRRRGGAIDEAPEAINKGFGRHGPRCTARVASFFDEKAPSGITRPPSPRAAP
jgi:hypothetical protein